MYTNYISCSSHFSLPTLSPPDAQHACMMPAQVFFKPPLPHHLPDQVWDYGISFGGFEAPSGRAPSCCGRPFEFRPRPRRPTGL